MRPFFWFVDIFLPTSRLGSGIRNEKVPQVSYFTVPCLSKYAPVIKIVIR